MAGAGCGIMQGMVAGIWVRDAELEKDKKAQTANIGKQTRIPKIESDAR